MSSSGVTSDGDVLSNRLTTRPGRQLARMPGHYRLGQIWTKFVFKNNDLMAERVGFEPTVRLAVQRFSNRSGLMGCPA